MLDAVLERGEAAEPVNCQCRISVTTSSTSTVVDAKTITAVPLTTRNFTQVLSMSSGSAADVNNAGTLGRGTQQCQCERQHHRRRVHPGRRLCPQRGAQSRHHLRS